MLPVEMPDGSMITLREPTKSEVEDVEATQNGRLREILALALSTNMEGRTFSAEALDDFTVTELVQFSQAYTDFINDLYPKN